MTIDQDTPVAASQPATDASSQEVSKPKRSTTTRSKAKPAAKPTSGKTASGKTASKSSESAPAKDSSDSKGASDSKAAQAESASSKTTAPKAAATAKAAGRSAGKTAKTATAKTKKTADASKEISGSTADAVAPKSAAATAAETPKAAGKTASRSSGKTTAKTSGRASTSNRAATPRTAKTAEASTPEATATAKTAETSEGSKQEAAPQKPAAKAPKGRPARAAAKSSAKATAQVTAQTIEAAPASTAPKAASPAADKPAISAALTSPAPAAQTPAKAAEQSAKQTPEQISDKPAETAPRQNAPAAERGQSPRQAADQNTSQTTSQPTDKTAGEPAAPAEQGAEQAAESGSASASGEAAAGDGPRRKNRRGRRGGRGRNRKKELNGQDGAQTAEDMTSTAPLDDDDEDLDLADDAPEQTSRAQDTRPQNAPRPNKPAKQAKPQQQQQQNKPENGKSAENSKPAESNKPATAANAGKAPAEAPKGKRRMFISVLPGEQVEVALAEDGQLLEYYLDMLHQRKIKGNIYKGVIHNIDTNLQAAFVSYGAGKNGFLQIDEVHPEYWLAHHEPSKGKKFPPIQKVLKAGQEVLVQVVKEPTGSKGAFLTTWLSLAGRFLVLTPGQDQIGVSRKVDDDEERSRLREMMNGIDPGQGLGVIVRTVSAGTTKTTLKNDLQYLKRVWRDIRKKATEVSAPTLIYQEPGLSERAVRDYLTEDVCEIWVDNDEVAQSVRDTVNLLFPRRKDLVRMHTDMRTPMWERFNLRRQLEQIYSREVLLPSGGRLVFDQTEALMAIDINSGKISGKGNFEAMAHKTNMEAAEAIARHLKLRDIGGQVVIDFIEMRDKKHVLEVEKTLRTAMKNDRARHDVARMSSFGLLELVRQRTGSSALAISLEPCPACGGTGMRRNIEWQALQALRELRRMVSAEPKEKCVYPASPELALYLLNHKRDTLREIEQDYGKCLEIMVRP
ncbi:MAG TPA: Rne/Rng family ribonuclease [Desulfovibrio sp.]|uniref:Rne/Rng family ribonuclease n=1 Tax=Desulfovibrio sp. TaxID=885 RepID=UPI002D2959FE|nr:Rne/Rng family ribonuclease [Desulfovibrio sp.]HZF62438.1 Rne/Rng family ribonuclease [Desulfovibrio sp.]